MSKTEKYIFEKLTPITDSNISVYESAINFAFEHDDVKNIAISGAYGAGKSSVLASYKDKHPNRKFMHISLAHFQNDQKAERFDTPVKDSILEGKILNQLIHQIPAEKIPQTNFRVKQSTGNKTIFFYTFAVALFLISLLHILFFNNWSRFVGVLPDGVIQHFLSISTSESFRLISGGSCFIISCFFFFQILLTQKNKSIFKKLSFQGNEIEIFEESDDSYFDKYLNEVLYLFENVEENVIVFEDMDRFDANRIFERLREINTLVNIQRKKNNKAILRFFYLLRDDIFISKDRTKFFDYIIPVIYYVGSSQYNRLKIPGEVFGSDFDVVWKRLGMTIGFGTMHISKATTLSLTEATSDGFNRINHVFGEGASPKMRLLTMAIRELIEATNEDSKDFSKHAMSRIVYGACLASNTSDYLLGKDDRPHYYTDMEQYEAGTQKIIDYWSERWLSSRLNYEPIYERIRAFDKNAFMVGNQIDGEKEWSFPQLEVAQMPANDETKAGLQFVRDFYRGSSGYADHIAPERLSLIHLKTRLDSAIIDAAKNGKDIVLTGNPGDGKTHIIRIIKPALEKLGRPIEIVLDASTLSNREIFDGWVNAHDNGKAFVIAINAAVLYSVNKEYGSAFAPIAEAYRAMTSSIVFHNEECDPESVVVFDLSKREVLTPEVLAQAITKLTSKEHYKECDGCPLHNDCVVTKNRALLNGALFQKRLSIVLERVVLQGYHATLREVQSLIAFLLFGNRTCKQLNQTAGNDEYDIANLVYAGKGGLFDAIRRSIDPVKISHPLWDEKIILNDLEADSWAENYKIPAEAIAYDNDKLFKLRKRQFYFFNAHGEELLTILDDDASKFQAFLQQDDKKIVKELIRKINAFFGSTKPSNSEMKIWSGHSTRILWSLRLMMIKRDSGSQTADTEMSVRILLDFITRKKRMLSISNLLR